MNPRDRSRGCFLGLFISDALGAPVEFKPPGSFSPITCYRSGGPHSLNAGDFTDDGSMALALADALRHGWDLKGQMVRYADWYENGTYSVNGRCFDIGCTTRCAIEKFQETQDALSSGDSSPESSGNGCIMRIAPVAIRYQGLFPLDYKKLAQLGAESSSVTHASEMCLSASSYMTVALAALIKGLSREQVLHEDFYNLPLHPSVEEVVKGSYKRKQPPEIKGSGFVVHCLEAALWAFYNAKDFSEAVLKAVNLGDDADTTGAVCGQFAGAFFGDSGIPSEMLNGLARMDMINHAFDGLIPY